MTAMDPPAPNEQGDEDMLVPRSDLVEGPQPMEAPEATGNTAGSQPEEDPQTAKFTWRVENFSRLNVKKLYSGIYELGDYKWRILIFPKGNNADYLSMYLDVGDSATLPYGWSRYAHFSLAVVNQVHSKYSVRKETQHQFNARENDWGFTSFMPLGELYDPSRGYLVNDTCVVEAEIAVYKAMDPWLYDSKKETGFVGLKNQGATCYMNSLLQTLYHIPYFRKVRISIRDDSLLYTTCLLASMMPSASIPLALQSLFYKLQYSDNSVATKELTKSFGWDTYDAFLQHDVQELNRVLCEKLEEKMKRTVVEGAIQQLFEGHHINYIDCINVDYKSSRKESFYDLQLDVKGCRDVYASFDKYVEVEHLDGDNKYHAEQYGLQDAKKGVLFVDFPPVLQLHLKRFEYDFIRDIMVKINDRYEFPLQLDLDRDNGKYLSPEADRRVRNLYTLHSVLVHSGGVHGGHYYAFIRPTLSSQWYKFDDERVTKEDMNKALEELYGGEEEERLKREQEEKEQKKKEKAEAHLYTVVKVACDEDFAWQIGRDVFFDLVDHEKVRSFRVQKLMPFNNFKEEVAKEFGIPVQFQRFWLWAKRQNHTYRPNRPLTHLEESQTVGYLRDLSNKVQNAELRLFLELELGLDLRPIPLPVRTTDDILLFFKLYDPERKNLGYASDEEIELYEEIKFEPSVMCEHIDRRSTFRSSQLEDGDIVCFQKSLSVQGSKRLRCPDVPSFFEYRHNLQVIHFRSLEKPKEDEFCLQLSKLDTYDEVVARVAHQLGVDDPSKIRLTSHNSYSQQPKPNPIKYRGVDNLFDMLLHYNQTSDILYYEILDMPLPELQGLRTLKVAFRHGTNNEMEIYNIRLPKESTVADVLSDLRMKAELSHPNAELRLLEVFTHRIYKIFPSSENIESINDNYWTLRAEEIPEEEKNLGPHDCLIHVYHFMNEENQNQMKIQNFGEPFLMVIREDEILAHVKIRVQKKLHVPDEEFSKWKFAFVAQGRAEYLQDSDILFSHFQSLQRSGIYVAWEQYLGLEHSDNSPKRSLGANQGSLCGMFILQKLDPVEFGEGVLACVYNCYRKGHRDFVFLYRILRSAKETIGVTNEFRNLT
ncbi:UNVERIFIED_CONTAM: Ubiquitin carboxyl-terminal hydrolase 12 [Sesamum latifolium]|uniref:ubiquitinyl hydrolase 1 n=1 Tax=Sesamum latifolium TaxID=2727402 RepID=A0AAW2Y525_9LAMI